MNNIYVHDNIYVQINNFLVILIFILKLRKE